MFIFGIAALALSLFTGSPAVVALPLVAEVTPPPQVAPHSVIEPSLASLPQKPELAKTS